MLPAWVDDSWIRRPHKAMFLSDRFSVQFTLIGLYE